MRKKLDREKKRGTAKEEERSDEIAAGVETMRLDYKSDLTVDIAAVAVATRATDGEGDRRGVGYKPIPEGDQPRNQADAASGGVDYKSAHQGRQKQEGAQQEEEEMM